MRALAKLLSLGVSVARIKTALNAIKKHHPGITPETIPSQYLVTDGEKVFLKHSNEILETLDGSGQMSFVFMIELASLHKEVLDAKKALEAV